jgi:hypothetical protein
MKFERENESDDSYRRWLVELDPWVERAIIFTLLLSLGVFTPRLAHLIATAG